MKAFKHKGQIFAVFLVSVCCASCPSWIDPHCSSCFCWYLTFNRILIKEQLRVIFWDKKFRIRLAAWTWVTLICVGSGGSHAGRLISWSRQFSQYLFWFLNQSRHNNYLHRWPFDLIFFSHIKKKKTSPIIFVRGCETNHTHMRRGSGDNSFLEELQHEVEESHQRGTLSLGELIWNILTVLRVYVFYVIWNLTGDFLNEKLDEKDGICE